MPTAPLRPCSAPGCPNRTAGGRCDVHADLARKQRGTWTSVYGSEWPRIRLDYLSLNPVCVLCGRLAQVAQHLPRGIRLLGRQKGLDPHADESLRALCISCHGKETRKRHSGGWSAQ